jgi:p-cumate 2,3-dioxygenase alpha subunit
MGDTIGTWVDDFAEEGLFKVSTEVFRAPEIFALERKRIFDRSWLYVGHESEVERQGDFVSRSVGGHPVIMVRGKGGDVRVLYNTCLHQGNQVCRVPSGHTSAFQCFFHGWTYDVDGKLVGLPGESSYGGRFTPEEHGLRAPRMASHRGFVFMCGDAETESLPDYLGPAAGYLDLVADQAEDMVVLPGSHRYTTHANWKMATMNAHDGYHVATTHATYLKYLRDMGVDPSQRRLGKRLDLGNGHSASEFFGAWGRPVARWAAYWPEFLQAELASKRAQLAAAFGAERARLMAEVDRNLLIFHNLVINDHSAVLIRTWDPVSVDKVVVTAWTIAPRDEAEEIRALRLRNYLTFFGPAGFATPDDIEALEGVQRGFRNQAVQWLDVSKGAATEASRPEEEDNADEIQLRAIWRRWRGDMGDSLLSAESR